MYSVRVAAEHTKSEMNKRCDSERSCSSFKNVDLVETTLYLWSSTDGLNAQQPKTDVLEKKKKKNWYQNLT